MDALQIRKNVLDIEERNFRTYFTTSIIIAFTILSIVISLMLYSDVLQKESSTLWMVGGTPIAVLVWMAFDYKNKANEKLNQIKKLKK